MKETRDEKRRRKLAKRSTRLETKYENLRRREEKRLLERFAELKTEGKEPVDAWQSAVAELAKRAAGRAFKKRPAAVEA